MEKIPCIKCNSTIWNYVRPYLEKWGYNIIYPLNFQHYPILVIDYSNKLGDVGDMPLVCIDMYNRELTQDIEEFLERAAKLKGFTYKRKDMNTEYDVTKLEVGMVVEYKSGAKRIVLSDAKGNIFLAGINAYKVDIRCNQKDIEIYKVYKIKHPDRLDKILNISNSNLILIWEKPREVELTMQEIADKFGIPVEQLKIKK